MTVYCKLFLYLCLNYSSIAFTGLWKDAVYLQLFICMQQNGGRRVRYLAQTPINSDCLIEVDVISELFLKGGSRGVSMVSKNWSDQPWLVFACISLIMSMLPYSYTFMCWKPVIKISRSALVSVQRPLIKFESPRFDSQQHHHASYLSPA